MKYRRSTAHPNLIIDYFQHLDTPEKCYWFGLLMADGCITRNTGVDSWQVRLTLKDKDGSLVSGFASAIGADLSKVRSRVVGGCNVMELRFGQRQFIQHLFNQGCIPQKTFKTRFPSIQPRNLQLCFLLGYFDGDGSIGGQGYNWSPVLCGGSELFLSEVKSIFGINSPIRKGSNYKGHSWFILCLGRNLFREMMNTFNASLPRKRVTA